ncbi:LIM domain-containing WLIM2b-like, partial [Olea europaea subsp. europaea]
MSLAVHGSSVNIFQLSNYSSMEGVLYFKPHFEQLFKEPGSFSENFQTRMPSLLQSPPRSELQR